MNEFYFYYMSCIDCVHSKNAYPSGTQCNHPLVQEMKPADIKSITEEEKEDIVWLAQRVFKLNVTKIGAMIPRFGWPMRYDPIWVNGCTKYESGKKEEKKDPADGFTKHKTSKADKK